jgi:hypothetical protein
LGISDIEVALKRLITGLLVVGVLTALTACDDVSVESVPNTGSTLCIVDYENCVDPIFHADINGRNGTTTCSASGCHDIEAGSGGGFKVFVNPSNPAEILSNFNAAKAFAFLNSPAQSKLLLEPLSGVSAISGTHAGGDIFPSTQDPCYQNILSWIANRVEDSDSSNCGNCTLVNSLLCGF